MFVCVRALSGFLASWLLAFVFLEPGLFSFWLVAFWFLGFLALGFLDFWLLAFWLYFVAFMALAFRIFSITSNTPASPPFGFLDFWLVCVCLAQNVSLGPWALDSLGFLPTKNWGGLGGGGRSPPMYRNIKKGEEQCVFRAP